jgi:hypothetical protein
MKGLVIKDIKEVSIKDKIELFSHKSSIIDYDTDDKFDNFESNKYFIELCQVIKLVYMNDKLVGYYTYQDEEDYHFKVLLFIEIFEPFRNKGIFKYIYEKEKFKGIWVKKITGLWDKKFNMAELRGEFLDINADGKNIKFVPEAVLLYLLMNNKIKIN